jgi:hypothetical protein
VPPGAPARPGLRRGGLPVRAGSPERPPRRNGPAARADRDRRPVPDGVPEDPCRFLGDASPPLPILFLDADIILGSRGASGGRGVPGQILKARALRPVSDGLPIAAVMKALRQQSVHQPYRRRCATFLPLETRTAGAPGCPGTMPPAGRRPRARRREPSPRRSGGGTRKTQAACRLPRGTGLGPVRLPLPAWGLARLPAGAVRRLILSWHPPRPSGRGGCQPLPLSLPFISTFPFFFPAVIIPSISLPSSLTSHFILPSHLSL